MTSPMGWSLGDARIPEIHGRDDDPYSYPDDFEWFAAGVHARQGRTAGRHRKPEAVLAMRGINLCPRCQDRHFRPYPEDPSYSCHQVECECWCSQGAGRHV